MNVVLGKINVLMYNLSEGGQNGYLGLFMACSGKTSANVWSNYKKGKKRKQDEPLII